MGLTPHERMTFDQLTDTLKSEGVLDGARKLRNRATLYTLGAVVGMLGMFVPLVLQLPLFAIPLFIGAAYCSLRAIDAWGKVIKWDGDAPVAQRGIIRRIMGL